MTKTEQTVPRTFIRLTENSGLMVDMWKNDKTGVYQPSLRIFYQTSNGWFQDKKRGFSVRSENFAKIVDAFRSDKIEPILAFGKAQTAPAKPKTAKKPLKGLDLDNVPF